MNATVNGRARKSLADQIDRLDKVLDGLADGLNDAIASAVQEAVRAVLKEVLVQQELLAKLQAETTVQKPAAEAKPTLHGRIAGVCRQAWARVKELFGSAGRGAATCAATAGTIFARSVKSVNAAVKNVRDRVVGSVVEGLAGLYLLRRLATSSTVVFAFGFGLGLGASFTGPWLLAAVGAVSAWRFRQTLAGLFGVG